MSAPLDPLLDKSNERLARSVLKEQRQKMKVADAARFPVLKLLKQGGAANLAIEFFRVSSDQQREGHSLDAQEEKSKSYKAENRLKSIRTWRVAESASKELARRDFFEMIDFVSANGIQNVIFDKIDRACRGLRAAVMIDDLIEAGVQFHFIRENLVVDKNSSPGEKLRFYLGVILAKHYIDNLRIEIQKGMDQRWEEGFSNGLAPIGYRNVRDGGGRARIEIDPVAGPAVKEAFELYVTGNYSYKAIEEFLKGRDVKVTRKIRKKEGDRITVEKVEVPFTDKGVEKMVCNPFYYGARLRKGNVIFTGKEQHQPLITKELFDRCQKIKGIRAVNALVSHAHQTPKPFMSLLKCEVCDHAVTGEIHKKKRTGRVYIYYHCANHDCDQRRINVRQEHILEGLKKAFEPFLRLTPKATTVFIEGLKEQIKDISLYSSDRLKELSEVKASIENRCKELEGLVDAGVLSEAEYQKVMTEKRTLLRQHDVEIEAHVTANQETFMTGLKVIELLGSAYQFMQLDGNDLDKVRLVRLVLSNLTLKDGSVGYQYQKPFDDLAPLTGGRNWWRRRESNPGP